MKKIINIQEAKTHLSRYVDQVAAGEELVIGKAGKPMAKLVPFKQSGKSRKLGRLAEQVYEAPDAWAEETDAKIAAELLGESSSTASQGNVAEDAAKYSSLKID